MGFSLGMAAAAYQGAKAEQRRLDADEFNRAQHAYAVANMDEYQSRRANRDNAAGLADERVTADREALPAEQELRQGRTDAGLTLLPKQTAVQTGLLDQQQHDIDLKSELNDTTDDTARTTAETNKARAESLAKMTEAEKITEGARIDAHIAGNAELTGQTRKKVLADVWRAGTTDQVAEESVIGRLNIVAKSNLFPELKGKTVADIKLIDSPTGKKMALLDGTGAEIMSMSAAEMEAAAASEANAQKPIAVGAGQALYKSDGKGGYVKVADNPKPISTTGRGAAGGSMQERLVAAIKAEAKAAGKPEPTIQEALQMTKADPEKWAVQLDKSDQRLQYETDPVKRLEIQNENRRSVGAKQLTAPNAPGLGSASSKTTSVISSKLGL